MGKNRGCVTPQKIQTEDAFATILWIIFDQGGCKAEIVRSEDVTGIIIMDDGDVSPVIRVDRLFKRFQEGESLDEIMHDLSEACDIFVERYCGFPQEENE